MMAEILLGLISLLVLVVSSGVLGNLLWRLVGFGKSRFLICEITLGLGLISYLFLGLAALGLLQFRIVVILLVLICFFSLRTHKEFYQFMISGSELKSLFGEIKTLSRFQKLCWGFVACFLIMALIEALAPATTADSLTYHLRIPYDYVENSGLIYSPFQPFNMPHLVQNLICLPFLFGAGEVGAHFIYFLFCILLIVAIFEFSNQHFSKNTALLAIILIISTPMFSYTRVSGMVEIALSTVSTMSLWAMFKAIDDKTEMKRWLLVAGFFIGMACGIKYYGLFLGVTIFVLILFSFMRASGLKVAIGSATIFVIGASVFGFPFYLKNFLITGNPIFPAFFEFFGGLDWSMEMKQMATLHFDSYKRLAGSSVWDFIMSPWNLTMDGERFLAGRSGYGFIYLAFLPLLLMRLVQSISVAGFRSMIPGRSSINILAWFVISFWLLWFVLAFHRGRHLMPVFVILSIVTAEVVLFYFNRYRSSLSNIIIRYSVSIVLSIGLIFQTFVAVYFTKNFLPVAVGYEKREAFLKRIRPMWEDYNEANQILPKNAKVLNLFGNRQYYLKRDQFYPSPYFQGWVDWINIKDVHEYRTLLKDAGFTHVIGSSYKKSVSIDQVKLPTVQNIKRFHDLNSQLIELYTRKIYQRSRSIPLSRTLPLETNTKTFALYELI